MHTCDSDFNSRSCFLYTRNAKTKAACTYVRVNPVHMRKYLLKSWKAALLSNGICALIHHIKSKAKCNFLSSFFCFCFLLQVKLQKIKKLFTPSSRIALTFLKTVNAQIQTFFSLFTPKYKQINLNNRVFTSGVKSKPIQRLKYDYPMRKVCKNEWPTAYGLCSTKNLLRRSKWGQVQWGCFFPFFQVNL